MRNEGATKSEMEGWLHIEATDTDESSGTKLAKNVFSLSFHPVLFSPSFFRCFRVSLALYRSFLAYCPLALNDLCACCGLRVHFAVAWPRVATEARVEVNKNWLLALHLSNVVAGLALQQQPCNFTPAAPFVVVSST